MGILVDNIHRYRHKFGFGVHSPLGYRMIWRVIRPDRHVGYYGYELLKENCRQFNPRLYKRACLLLRLAAEVSPSYYWVTGKNETLWKEAIRYGAGERCHPADIQYAKLIVIEFSGQSEEVHISTILKKMQEESDVTIVCFGNKKVSDVVAGICNSLRSGVAFEAKGDGIILSRNGVAPHVYTLP